RRLRFPTGSELPRAHRPERAGEHRPPDGRGAVHRYPRFHGQPATARPGGARARAACGRLGRPQTLPRLAHGSRQARREGEPGLSGAVPGAPYGRAGQAPRGAALQGPVGPRGVGMSAGQPLPRGRKLVVIGLVAAVLVVMGVILAAYLTRRGPSEVSYTACLSQVRAG